MEEKKRLDALTVLGYLGAVIVLSCYALSIHLGNPTIFNFANVIGGLMMIGGQIRAGVWYGAFVTGTFALIGAYGLLVT